MIIKVGDWDLAQHLLQNAPKLVSDAIKKAVWQEALFLSGEVKKKIRTGPFKGLSAWTLAGRRAGGFKGTKPLNVSGDMKAAVTVFPNKPAFECFVGVLKTARRTAKITGGDLGKSSSGQSKGTGKGSGKAEGSKKAQQEQPLVNIAKVLEEGRTFMLQVTPRMRRFIMGVLVPQMSGGSGGGGGLKKGVIVIHIPARPFIRPVIEEFAPTMPARFQQRLGFLLAGKLADKATSAPPKPEADSKQARR